MIIQCCTCFKLRVDGRWVDTGLKSSILASHTYCPECEKKAFEAINKIKEARKCES